jgi:hypothetical protein
MCANLTALPRACPSTNRSSPDSRPGSAVGPPPAASQGRQESTLRCPRNVRLWVAHAQRSRHSKLGVRPIRAALKLGPLSRRLALPGGKCGTLRGWRHTGAPLRLSDRQPSEMPVGRVQPLLSEPIFMDAPAVVLDDQGPGAAPADDGDMRAAVREAAPGQEIPRPQFA